jgi:nucleoside-diphosphate-sugar epimerase
MMRVAITGSSGFIGRSLLSKAHEAGWSVRALTRTNSQPLPPHTSAIQGDLNQRDRLVDLVKECDLVIHLAGATKAQSTDDFFRVNAAGTTQLIEAMETHAPTARLIHISSLAAREPHLSAYAASKSAAERIVSTSSLNWTILRPPAVYGPCDQELKPLWVAMSKGFLIGFGDRQARFSLLHVEDLVSAIVAIANDPAHPMGRQQLLEIDDGHSDEAGLGYGWETLRELGASVFHRRIRSVHCPAPVLKLMAMTTEAVSRLDGKPRVFGPGKYREIIHPDWVARPSMGIDSVVWSPQRRLRDTLSTLI